MPSRHGRAWVLGLILLFTLTACGPRGSMPEQAREGNDVSPEAVRFTDVTTRAGLGEFRYENGAFGAKWMPETYGAGGAFVDYDGDGWLDVLLVGGRSWPGRGEPGAALELYRNRGDGTFERVTREAGLGAVHAYGFGITAGDYDGDGDPDVYLTALHENILLENRDGRFVDVTDRADVGGGDRWSTSALFFDADRDGDLDLFVGNYVEWSAETDVRCTVDGQKTYCQPKLYPGTPSRYFENQGNGTFSDATERAGFTPMPGNTLGVAALDYNRDGWTDLILANDLEPNLLYRNDGKGTFTEVGRRSGVAFSADGNARGSMGIDAGDADGDGHVDVFIGNFSGEMTGVFTHLRDDLFVDRAAVSGIGQPSLEALTFGTVLFDPDGDGDLDLLTANGHIRPLVRLQREGISYRQPVQLFRHLEHLQFELVEADSDPLGDSLVARGAAVGDYDRDGDEDLLLTENTGSVRLWRNDTDSLTTLRFNLRGTESNREGIGSRLDLYVGSDTLTRYVRTGSSYLSQSELTVTFGLEGRGRPDSLHIAWPSGRMDRYVELIPGRGTYRAVEGGEALETLGSAR